jgi:hypothetical protein
MEQFREFTDLVGTAVDTAGVATMVIGAFLATGRFLIRRQGDMLGAIACAGVPGGW